VIFNQSWFLDIMTDGQWDALVQGDYQAVMPLIWKKRLGLYQLVQPYFVQQSGVSGIVLKPESVAGFIRAIPSKFIRVRIAMNTGNDVPELDGYSLKNRSTYQLKLNASYDELSAGFSSEAKKILRKAGRSGLKLSTDLDLDTVFSFYDEAYGVLNKHVPDRYFRRFRKLAERALQLGTAKLYGVISEQGEILGAGLFFINKHYITYSFAAPGPGGRKHDAMHVLISEVIKKFAGSGLTFDFEGSDIPTVAYFYAKFGSEKKVYQTIRKKMF
jgi:hypothetical protein